MDVARIMDPATVVLPSSPRAMAIARSRRLLAQVRKLISGQADEDLTLNYGSGGWYRPAFTNSGFHGGGRINVCRKRKAMGNDHALKGD